MRVGNDNVIHLVQPANAPSSMVVNPSGKSMLVRNAFPAMPRLPMESSVEGRVIEERFVSKRVVIVYYLGSLHNRIGATDIHASRERTKCVWSFV